MLFAYTPSLQPTLLPLGTSALTNNISVLYTMLRDKLEFIRTRIKQYYDKHRLEGPRLERGDKVYLIS